MSQHAYSRAAAKELNRLDEQARKDICTIVPLLTREMVEEACMKRARVSESARILRQAGIWRIGENTYRIDSDEAHSLICMFDGEICAILSIQHGLDHMSLDAARRMGAQS